MKKIEEYLIKSKDFELKKNLLYNNNIFINIKEFITKYLYKKEVGLSIDLVKKSLKKLN